jgi:O-antigen ligase
MITDLNAKELKLYQLIILSGVFFTISFFFVKNNVLSIPLLIFCLLFIGILSKNTFILISWSILIFYSVWIFKDESAFKFSIPLQLTYLLFVSTAKIKLNKSDYILIFIGLWTSLSFIYNEIISNNSDILRILLKSYINLIIIIIFFFLNKQQPINRNNLFRLFILSVFILSFIPFFKEKEIPSNEVIDRISGLADVNTFCKFSALAIYLNINHNYFKYTLKLIITIVLIIATLLTFSKMGVILLIVVFLPHYKNIFKIKVLLPVIITFFVIGLMVREVENRNIDLKSFIENRILPERNDNSTINRLSSDRTYIWKSSLSYWTKFPSTFVFGQGIGTMSTRNIIVFGEDKAIHNTVLELFLEIGLLGMILYLIFLLILLKNVNWTLKLIVLIPLLFLSGPFRYDMFLVFVLIEFYKDKQVMKNIENKLILSERKLSAN